MAHVRSQKEHRHPMGLQLVELDSAWDYRFHLGPAQPSGPAAWDYIPAAWDYVPSRMEWPIPKDSGPCPMGQPCCDRPNSRSLHGMALNPALYCLVRPLIARNCPHIACYYPVIHGNCPKNREKQPKTAKNSQKRAIFRDF